MKRVLLMLSISLAVGCSGRQGEDEDSNINCGLAAQEMPTVFDGDTAYLFAVIDEQLDAGADTIELPAGEFYIDESFAHFGEISGRHIRGAGIEQTILWSAPELDTNVFSVNHVSDLEISDLTIIGNLATSELGHCLRAEETSNLFIHDVEMYDCSGYEIGLQRGVHSNPRFENIYISNTLRDGFDIKNHESSNAGLVMRDIEVKCHAQGSEDLTDAQAGIDIRGHNSALYDIRVTGISGSGRGIRFRSGTLGAMGSFVEGYEIECIDAVRTVGIELRAPDTSVQYGTITGCGVGVLRRIVEE